MNEHIKTNREGVSALLFHWIVSYYDMKALAQNQISLAMLYDDMHDLNMGTLIEDHPFLIKRTLRQVHEFSLDFMTNY